MAGGVAEVVFGGEGGRVGDGALEEGLGFGVLLEVNQDVGVVVEEGGVLRGAGDERGVEGSGLVVLLVAAVEAGEEAGEGRVFGVGGVELFRRGDGLGRFALAFRRGWRAGR